ncbi:conserved hypothetical protein [Hyphomicrobiales bacterium]|jgi:hypothetical protein|nr:conserved hypothetical protein [Hyphomicrobiales bacterium]CAH1702335.1 conserved hypothetical protein [Hyphomicrobiales bacterium]CAI0346536.1 conserved hypothetical protein [Hyphomicrobiales bacterium]
MNEEAFHRIRNLSPSDVAPRIAVDDGPDRTLLYGWSAAVGEGSNRTWHVYREDGQLHLFVYSGPKPTGEVRVLDESEATRNALILSDEPMLISGTELGAALLVPPKRAYPAACDEDFCARLLALGVHISFTTFEARPEKPFHGLRASDLPAPSLRP